MAPRSSLQSLVAKGRTKPHNEVLLLMITSEIAEVVSDLSGDCQWGEGLELIREE